MKNLEANYAAELEKIKSEIQASEELTLYLDEEEEEQYKALVDKFEGKIHLVYEEVAKNDPLQLVKFEEHLLDHDFEGLYLPKILGYSVLRGQLNDDFKYYRPQNHFKTLLEFIVESSNFEQISKRVGQSIQMGFALSSDIWITNIINSQSNKRVKSFIQSQNLTKYHDPRNRKTGYVKYGKQFQSLNFYTANFPKNKQELHREFELLKAFLLYRAEDHLDNNQSFTQEIKDLINSHDTFGEEVKYIEILLLLGLKYNLDAETSKTYTTLINKWRNEIPEFETLFFTMLKDHWFEFKVTRDDEMRLSKLIDKTASDKLSGYFKVLDTIHEKSYISEEAISEVRDFYYANEGLSVQNACIRNTIFKYFGDLLAKLEVNDYNDYFEINKTVGQYMNIFDNQHFNQDVKDSSLTYIKKLLKHYTDKRGKDYQDIKRFVLATFQDFNFMNEKQIKDLFKTKRKVKTPS